MEQTENQVPDAQGQQDARDAGNGQLETTNEKKKSSRTARRVRSVIIWVVLIALMIFLVLFLSYKISDEFESIGDMLNFIRMSIGGNPTA